MSASSSGLLHLLQERGFVHQRTDATGLGVALGAGPLTAYLGFDATADSLHVGHLQGLMLMRRLQRAGHRPLMLVGGATTRIGDPSFRDTSRPLLDADGIAANIAGIRTAFSRYLGADVAVADNADWLDGLGYLDFLGSVGRHFNSATPCCKPTTSSNWRAVTIAACRSAAPTSGPISSTASTWAGARVWTACTG